MLGTTDFYAHSIDERIRVKNEIRTNIAEGTQIALIAICGFSHVVISPLYLSLLYTSALATSKLLNAEISQGERVFLRSQTVGIFSDSGRVAAMGRKGSVLSFAFIRDIEKSRRCECSWPRRDVCEIKLQAEAARARAQAHRLRRTVGTK